MGPPELDDAVAKMPIQGLSYAVRTAYGDTFRLALVSGAAKPLLLPWCLLGPFVMPALWLAIPHRRRTWFYQTRWLAMAAIVWSNMYYLRYASSTNMACAYAAGLAATWGTVLSANLLIWTRPQFDAARMRRVKKDFNFVKEVACEEDNNAERHTESEPTSHGEKGNTKASGGANELRKRKQLSKVLKPHVTQQQEEYDYIWEPYPSGGFLERLAWSTDLILSFRGAGWNWSAPSIPRPKVPSQISHGDKVDLDSMPTVSRSGYKRYLTQGEFVRDRLVKAVVFYFVLDFLSVYMVKDPYFILGPDHKNYVLPPLLQGVPPWLLLLYRELFCLAGVYAAIEAVFAVSDLAQYWLANCFYPSRGFLFHFPSTFGSFEQVLDRGLAGWWGSMWHQTFRVQFAAPATHLFRGGHLKKGSPLASLLAIFISFSQSGILHASGSLTSVPRTKPWRAPAFFFLQATGIVIQHCLAWIFNVCLPRPPRAVARLGNLFFALAWLYFTAPLFIDDLSSTGLWLVEPVPVSLFRFLGFGHPGDHWWRWDWDHLPKLYVGETWWETGIAL